MASSPGRTLSGRLIELPPTLTIANTEGRRVHLLAQIGRSYGVWIGSAGGRARTRRALRYPGKRVRYLWVRLQHLTEPFLIGLRLLAT